MTPKKFTKKTYFDLVEVITELYMKGFVEVVMEYDGVSVNNEDITHHFNKYTKPNVIMHSHRGNDRLIEFSEAISIVETFNKEVFEIRDRETLHRVKRGAKGVLANKQKFLVDAVSSIVNGVDLLSIKFDGAILLSHQPLEVLRGSIITQERD